MRKKTNYFKEAEIRMEKYEKHKNDFLKQREACFAELTKERYLELINNYENLNECNKADRRKNKLRY